MPIEALTKIELVEHSKSEKLEIKMHINDLCQKTILKKYNLPSVTKNFRDVEFHCSRKTSARDFLWNLKRIHHWWNFAKPSGNMNNGKELEVKVIQEK